MEPRAAPANNALLSSLECASVIWSASADLIASALTGSRPAPVGLVPPSAVMATITVAIEQAVLFLMVIPSS